MKPPLVRVIKIRAMETDNNVQCRRGLVGLSRSLVEYSMVYVGVGVLVCMDVGWCSEANISGGC